MIGRGEGRWYLRSRDFEDEGDKSEYKAEQELERSVVAGDMLKAREEDLQEWK